MTIRPLLMITCLVAPIAAAQQATWHAEVLIESNRGMGGAAIGDLDSESAGNEVAVVNAAGEVWLARRTGDSWRPKRLHKGSGEMIMCAIGDVDPRYAGSEFVGVGMVQGEESLSGPGQVLMIRRDGDEWNATQIFEDSHMIHGVAIGDVSTRTPGHEIIACGFNHRVTLLARDGERWRSEVIYVGNNRMKIAAVADVLTEREGLEVVVAGTDGNVVLLWEDRLGWKHEIIYSDAVGQSRVACGAFGVLIGGDKGKVTLAQRKDGRWVSECLARDSGKIRGVAIADIDPQVPGPECVSGRAKPARTGRVKTSHLRRPRFAVTAYAASSWRQEAVHGESAQDGQDSLHSDVTSAGLVAAADRASAGRRPGDGRPLRPRSRGPAKPAKPAHRVGGAA